MAQQVASLYADIGAKIIGFEQGAAKVMGGLGKLALSVGSVTAAIEIMSKAFEFSKEGAQLERLADSGAEIARQYGGNMDLIVQKVKEASLGTVSEMDIIASANKAMMLGLGADADQLANLMEIAAFRGRAMGVSTTQAFDDIVRGIGRASPMILDNLGIVVSAKETYDNYAKEIGKSATELTKAEKTQALLNAVLESGNSLLDESGGLVEDNASKYERLNARVKDYKDNLKRTLNEGITPSIEAFLDYADAMDKAEEATGRTDQRSRVYLGAMQLQLDQEEELRNRINDTSAARWEGLASMYAGTTAMEEATFTAEELEAQLEAVSDANKNFISTVENIQNAEERYNERVKSLTEERLKLEKKKKDLILQGYNEQSKEIAEVNADLDENTQAAQRNADEHEQANRRIILGLLERKLTQDGILDDAELEWLLQKGQAWGIYSQTVIDETRAAMAEVNALAMSINGIPSSRNFTFTINTIGSIPSGISAQTDQISQKNKQGRAYGGAVTAGNMYEVNELGTPELLTFGGKQMLMMPDSGSGYVTPLEAGKEQTGMKQERNPNQGGSFVPNADKNLIDYKKMGRAIRDALNAAGG